MNPFRAVNTVSRLVQQARMLQNDPSQISKLLLDNGRIGQSQYDAIKNMKSPSEIGQYLMNNGILDQGTVNRYASMMPNIMG